MAPHCDPPNSRAIRAISGSIATIFLLAIAYIVLAPGYRYLAQTAQGEGELRIAEYRMRIQLQEAETAKQVAELAAEAEMIRLRGSQEADKIASQLSDKYLQYLLVRAATNAEHVSLEIPLGVFGSGEVQPSPVPLPRPRPGAIGSAE